MVRILLASLVFVSLILHALSKTRATIGEMRGVIEHHCLRRSVRGDHFEGLQIR